MRQFELRAEYGLSRKMDSVGSRTAGVGEEVRCFREPAAYQHRREHVDVAITIECSGIQILAG